MTEGDRRVPFSSAFPLGVLHVRLRDEFLRANRVPADEHVSIESTVVAMLRALSDDARLGAQVGAGEKHDHHDRHLGLVRFIFDWFCFCCSRSLWKWTFIIWVSQLPLLVCLNSSSLVLL